LCGTVLPSRDTRLLHVGRHGDDVFRASAAPLYQTATFRQTRGDAFDAFDYTRTDNPTRAILEARLADLEGGTRALAYASGMAAIDAVLALVPVGGRLVVGRDLYGGTLRLVGELARERGIAIADADSSDADALADTIASHRPSWVLVESPTNPHQSVTDIAAAARVAHEHGARLAVDNTMLTGYLQQPLALGADAVLLSATKHLGGHGDVTAGAVVVRDDALGADLARRRNTHGTALAPFEAWLLARGLDTLGVRIDRAQTSALTIARFLAAHPAVSHVRYAGLASHPGHALLEAQARGAGSVVAFETGDAALSLRLVEALRLFSIAVSFGSTVSTASLPFAMSHASVPLGLSATIAPPRADLVRLSIGLEDPRDLVHDLELAFEVACASRSAGANANASAAHHAPAHALSH
jgi:cystathionine beta-lyase